MNSFKDLNSMIDNTLMSNVYEKTACDNCGKHGRAFFVYAFKRAGVTLCEVCLKQAVDLIDKANEL